MALTAKQLSQLRSAPIGPGSNRLATAMEIAGLTQAQLADAAGLTQPYISAVSRGIHATVTVENAHKLAGAFGCQIEDLFPAKSEVA